MSSSSQGLCGDGMGFVGGHPRSAVFRGARRRPVPSTQACLMSQSQFVAVHNAVQQYVVKVHIPNSIWPEYRGCYRIIHHSSTFTHLANDVEVCGEPSTCKRAPSRSPTCCHATEDSSCLPRSSPGRELNPAPFLSRLPRSTLYL